MRRIFGYALKRLLRSPGTAIPTLGVLTLLIFFVNILLVAHWMTEGFVTSIIEKLPLTVYLKSEYSRPTDQTLQFVSDLKSLDSAIQAKYVTPQEALARQKERFPDLVAILEAGDENPLPASLVVSIPTPKLYDAVNVVIKKYKQLTISSTDKTLADYGMQFAKIKQATRTLEMVQNGIMVLILFFVLSLITILYVSIGNSVFVWQEEIRIAQLVGGSRTFIHGPFAAQGALLSGVASICALIAFSSVLSFLANTSILNFRITSDSAVYALGEFFGSHLWMLSTEVFIFVLLGTFSAAASSFVFTKISK